MTYFSFNTNFYCKERWGDQSSVADPRENVANMLNNTTTLPEISFFVSTLI